MTSAKFNRASNLKRAGRVAGFLMGRAVTNTETAFQAFDKLAKGKPSEFLSHATKAISVAVEKVASMATAPMQLAARDLVAQAKESRLGNAFKRSSTGVKEGYAEGRASRHTLSAPKPKPA